MIKKFLFHIPDPPFPPGTVARASRGRCSAIGDRGGVVLSHSRLRKAKPSAAGSEPRKCSKTLACRASSGKARCSFSYC